MCDIYPRTNNNDRKITVCPRPEAPWSSGRTLTLDAARPRSIPWEARIIRCKNLALYIRDCESLCLSDETVKAVGPFYLVSMPGEVKDPTQGVNV